jgi:3-hydroxypropanoate dehydrogenase
MLALADAAADLLFREAHTADRFAPDHVPDERIAAIWDLIKWGPTSGNTCPGRLLLVRSRAARERLVGHMNENNRAKTLAAPLTVVTAADLRFHERWPALAPHRAERAAQLEHDLQARERLAIPSATIQTAYFILGVRAAGLAAGPMGGFNHEGIDAEFFPDGRWRSVLVINLGMPAPDGYRKRLPRPLFEDISRVV